MARPNPNPNRSHEAEPLRDWAGLPHDVLSAIFKKAGPIPVLTGAQFVCRPWRRVSFDPSIWRRIDMAEYESAPIPVGLGNLDKQSLAREAIDRAQGHVEEFSAEEDLAASDLLLSYLADRTSNLRRLRLTAPGISPSDNEGLVAVLSRSPLLEDLEVTYDSFPARLFKVVGESCLRLQRFCCVDLYGDIIRYWDSDAYGIADNMPQLHHLEVGGSIITKDGLTAVLDRCVHLESLDLSFCRSSSLDASVLEKCARIKDVRLPDPIPDSEIDSWDVVAYLA